MDHTENFSNSYLKIKNISDDKLKKEAKKLFLLLKKRKIKIVFTESCTGGKAASVFCEIPNISEVFCGSFVVYREKSKIEWLQINKNLLKKYTHVSKEITFALAKKALQHTSEADLSVAITGHFGPKCLKSLEGIFHIAFLNKKTPKKNPIIWSLKIEDNAYKKKWNAEKIRAQRQITASHSIFLMVRSLLSQS